MGRRGPEALVEDRVCAYARRLGLVAKKLSMAGPYGDRSWPDRMFLAPGGRVLFVEFKAPGERPTDRQAANHAMLRGLGFDAYTIDQVAPGRELLEAFAAGR